MGFFNRNKKREVLEDENSIKERRQEQQDLKEKNEELSKRLRLFSIDAGLEDDLNKNIVSEGLKEGFKTEGFSLFKDTDISKKRDDKWIIDKREEESYIVRKEDGKLNIYRGTKISQELLDKDKFGGSLATELRDGNITHHLEIIRRITKYPAHLCIFESKAKIYVYVTLNKYKNVFDSLAITSPSHNAFSSESGINIMECLGIVSINKQDKLKKDWVGCIKNNNENIIKEYGEDLWNELIPKGIKKTLEAELESDNEIKDVWIFCECEDIDYLWEGIYLKEKNLFWGDEFHMIRIPKDRIDQISKNCEFKSPYQINNVAFIVDEDCQCIAKDKNCFSENSVINLQQDSDKLKKLKDVDCVHLVASIGTFEDRHYYELCAEALKERNNNLMFLFLNIRIPPNEDASKYPLLPKLKELFTSSAEIWVDTSLDLPDDPELSFTEIFYEKLRGSPKNIPKVATEARGNCKICKNFCRLAYVVSGNPCPPVTWVVDKDLLSK